MNFVNDDNTMPIVGFYGPHVCEYESSKGWKIPDYLTEQCYRMIQESGINLLSYCENDYASAPEVVIRTLELAEQYGIGMYVTDSGVRLDMTKDELEERIRAYCHYRSFKGIKVCDEPSSPEYGDKARMLEDYYGLMNTINSHPDLNGYINLYAYHPDWIGVDNNTFWLDREHFEAYVDAYCKYCSPKMLSEDYYIFDAHGVETSKDYFENLEIMNLYAQKYDIPYWVHIQVGGQWNDAAKAVKTIEYYPRPNETIWNVNTALAYGAKGIQYFPLIQPYYFAFAPDGEMDFRRNGLINANGEKSQWFDCVKDANTQIQAVGGYMLCMTHKAMLTVGHYARVNLPKSVASYGSLACVEQQDSENQYGFIIGCFDYDGKEAYYVVNNDVKNTQTAVLHFEVDHICHMISSDCDKHIKAKEFEVELEPARAVLIIVE